MLTRDRQNISAYKNRVKQNTLAIFRELFIETTRENCPKSIASKDKASVHYCTIDASTLSVGDLRRRIV